MALEFIIQTWILLRVKAVLLIFPAWTVGASQDRPGTPGLVVTLHAHSVLFSAHAVCVLFVNSVIFWNISL